MAPRAFPSKRVVHKNVGGSFLRLACKELHGLTFFQIGVLNFLVGRKSVDGGLIGPAFTQKKPSREKVCGLPSITICSEILDLGLRLLLAMRARPDLITRRERLPQDEKLRRKGAKEVWKPNYLGRAFRQKTDSAAPNLDESSNRFGPRCHGGGRITEASRMDPSLGCAR